MNTALLLALLAMGPVWRGSTEVHRPTAPWSAFSCASPLYYLIVQSPSAETDGDPGPANHQWMRGQDREVWGWMHRGLIRYHESEQAEAWTRRAQDAEQARIERKVKGETNRANASGTGATTLPKATPPPDAPLVSHSGLPPPDAPLISHPGLPLHDHPHKVVSGELDEPSGRNFGVTVEQLHRQPGNTFTTTDPNFNPYGDPGPGRKVPMPTGATAAQPSYLPMIVVFGVGSLVILTARKRNS